MKRVTSLFAICAVLLAGALAFGQQTPVPQPALSASYDMGVFYAPNFGKWQVPLGSAITGGATTVFNAAFAVATTPDGLVFVPFAVNERITIGLGSTQDTVTISALSNCNPGANAVPGQPVVCSITVSGAPTNSHSSGEPILSADNGIMEATGYAANTGGGQVYFLVDCGIITLNTGAATTTSTCFIPNQYISIGGATRVTTTITTSASYSVGSVNATTSMITSCTALTAGTTCIAFQSAPASALVTGATAANLTALLITANASAGAGALHAKVWGFVEAQPAF